MDLPIRWALLVEAIGTRGDFKELFTDLDRRYREPGRFYHTWEHVADCLAELDAAPGLCDTTTAVELALWFHDAVYDPRAVDNEVRSAALLREAAARLGIDAGLADRAAVLVMTTAPARGAAEGAVSSRDAAAIRDIDLSILGSPPARFGAYEAAVRREYAFLPESAWKAGRSRVLRTFLGLPRIFLTAAFHDRLEQQARANLAASVQRLS
jgi:predicted metal-dependent HD superfamily phosphohydrolase